MDASGASLRAAERAPHARRRASRLKAVSGGERMEMLACHRAGSPDE